MTGLVQPLLGLVLAPLFIGIVNRTKAWFAGRKGPQLAQPYYDLWKLLQKGAVFSNTTTLLFRLGPAAGLAATLVAVFLVPLGDIPSPLAFAGDFILLAYLFGFGRFFAVLAALDTGSSFEGMGASREALISALAEPALLISLLALGRLSGAGTLSGMYSSVPLQLGSGALPTLAAVLGALLLVMLAECCRIPIDDPTTHLELTMIHEVMVLDHGGPDLALIEYGSALKLWCYAALMAGLLLPLRGQGLVAGTLEFLLVMALLAVLLGVIESVMARLKLERVGKLLLSALILASLGLFVQQW